MIEQRTAGNRSIIGAMLESNLFEGNQPVPKNPADLIFGVSVTDECMSWDTTERLLRYGHDVLRSNKVPRSEAELPPVA